MAWGIGRWLMFPFMQKVGPQVVDRLKARIAADLTTTFASSYTQKVSLAGALSPAAVAAYAQRSTRTKYLVDPGKNLASPPAR